LFSVHFPKLFRVLDRLSGDPDLAADLAQETFVRLYRRGALPESPASWLITVAMNLYRNAASKQTRRLRLLTRHRSAESLSDPEPSPDRSVSASEARARVRAALGSLPEREQRLLLLRAEGFSYRDIAEALRMNPASVGTLLARAKVAFREVYEEACDAP
jgi:RNA polymerase sigma-70 factor (ECF subfamily)